MISKQALNNIQAAIDRLDAWAEGEKIAQMSAEQRQDRVSAETHYNQGRNYEGLVNTLKDAIGDLEATE